MDQEKGSGVKGCIKASKGPWVVQARCCIRGQSENVFLSWLCDIASKMMDVLFGLGVSTRTLVDNGLRGAVVFKGGDQ